MNELAGNPNFTRADGSHVVIDATDYNPADIPNDGSLDEWFGDASSVGAQGTVTYDYSAELPFSGLPSGCTFVIKGDAPGASLIDLSLVDPSAQITTVDGVQEATISQSMSQIIAGIQNAALLHADVISESYGSGGGSGGPNPLWAGRRRRRAGRHHGRRIVRRRRLRQHLHRAGRRPGVIGVGASTTLRLEAQAYGFPSWVSDQIATLSSTGVGQPFSLPNNSGRLVDLVAPGYGGEAACSPLVTNGCPTNALTEAFGGTSESAPFVAGAAADVIEAYANTHNGERPTPAMVKQILDGTASDINAPAGEQGAGEVNIYQAVLAAEQMPFTTIDGASKAPGLLSTPTQVDVSGDGGTKVPASLSVYNASTKATTVTAQLRKLGAATQLDPTVTENVSAPDPSLPVPADGAQAAAPITFNVPAGVDHLNANMIWPDPTNSNILYYILTDPQGRLTQISYDYGTGFDEIRCPWVGAEYPAHRGQRPEPGTWTATILWGNGRSHLQEPPNVPGTYTGPMSFQVTGQNYVTSASGAGTVKIPAQSSGTVNVNVPLAKAPGDNESSIQLTGANGATASVPVLARTVIPSTGGSLQGNDGNDGRAEPGVSELAVLHRCAIRPEPDERVAQDSGFQPGQLVHVRAVQPVRAGGGRRRDAEHDGHAAQHRRRTQRAGEPVRCQPGRRQMVDRRPAQPDDQWQRVQSDGQGQRHVQQLRRDRPVGVADLGLDDARPGLDEHGPVADHEHDRHRPDVHVLLQPGGTRRHRDDEHLHRGGRDEAGVVDVDSERGAWNGRHRQSDRLEHHVGSPAKGHATANQRIDGGGAPLHLHGRAAGRLGGLRSERSPPNRRDLGARLGRIAIGTSPFTGQTGPCTTIVSSSS